MKKEKTLLAAATMLAAFNSSAAIEVISVDPSCSDVNWSIPTEREDGNTLAQSEIAEFVIYYGREPRVYDGAESVQGTRINCSDLGLVDGTYYIAGITIDTNGVTSQLSNEITRVIVGKPNAPVLGAN